MHSLEPTKRPVSDNEGDDYDAELDELIKELA